MRCRRPGFSLAGAAGRSEATEGAVLGSEFEASTGARPAGTSWAGLKTGSDDNFTTSTLPVAGGAAATAAGLCRLVAGVCFGTAAIRGALVAGAFGGAA